VNKSKGKKVKMMKRLGAIFLASILGPGTLTIHTQAPGAMDSSATIKVVLVGDSTVAVESGWGPGFCAHVVSAANCVDMAASGRSSKSFIDEGLWQKALAERGQFYFIQFGHNDQKDSPALHTDPGTSFKVNLRQYISDVQKLHAVPVLVTPLSRRNYKDGQLIVDPLHDYAAAMREVAAEEHIPLIDLYQFSRTLLESMTQEQADQFDATDHKDAGAGGSTAANTPDRTDATNHQDAGVGNSTANTPDRTHLNLFGKETFGTIVANAAAHAVPALAPYISPEGKTNLS
jgi:lysophospholipase L1-like esterase